MVGPIGPGPGAYMLPSCFGYRGHDPCRWRNPSWTMSPRYPLKKDENYGGVYGLQNMTRFGKVCTTGFSIIPRPNKSNFRSLGPGPGAYDTMNSPRLNGPSSPAYSVTSASPRRHRNHSPPPNAYRMPQPVRTPAYNIGSKTPIKERSRSPGPIYNIQHAADISMHTSPCASVKGRRLRRACKDKVPAPNAYNVKPERGPAFSIGGRHKNEWIRPYITKMDDMDCL